MLPASLCLRKDSTAVIHRSDLADPRAVLLSIEHDITINFSCATSGTLKSSPAPEEMEMEERLTHLLGPPAPMWGAASHRHGSQQHAQGLWTRSAGGWGWRWGYCLPLAHRCPRGSSGCWSRLKGHKEKAQCVQRPHLDHYKSSSGADHCAGRGWV